MSSTTTTPSISPPPFTDAEKLHLLEELMRTHVFEVDWNHIRLPPGRTLYQSRSYLSSLHASRDPSAPEATVSARLNPTTTSEDHADTTTPAPSKAPILPSPPRAPQAPIAPVSTQPPPQPHVTAPSGLTIPPSLLIADTSPLLLNHPRPSSLATPARVAASASLRNADSTLTPASTTTPGAAATTPGDSGSAVKRKRGRPRKYPALSEELNGESPGTTGAGSPGDGPVVKRGRGRPRKNPLPAEGHGEGKMEWEVA